MAETRLTICDRCGEAVPVERWWLKNDRESRSTETVGGCPRGLGLDLCSKCSDLLVSKVVKEWVVYAFDSNGNRMKRNETS